MGEEIINISPHGEITSIQVNKGIIEDEYYGFHYIAEYDLNFEQQSTFWDQFKKSQFQSISSSSNYRTPYDYSYTLTCRTTSDALSYTITLYSNGYVDILYKNGSQISIKHYTMTNSDIQTLFCSLERQGDGSSVLTN